MEQVSVSPHSILPCVKRSVSLRAQSKKQEDIVIVTYSYLFPENLVLGRSVADNAGLGSPLTARVGGLAPCEVNEGHVLLERWGAGDGGREERDGAGDGVEVHVDGCECWRARLFDCFEKLYRVLVMKTRRIVMSLLQGSLKLIYIPARRPKAYPSIIAIVVPVMDTFSAMTMDLISGVLPRRHVSHNTSAAEDLRATLTVN